MTLWRLLAVLAVMWAGGAAAQQPSPHEIDIPRWFATTFLDFREDIDDAVRDGRRLLVYFGQDGCPYCTMLMTVNFSQRGIVAKTQQHFVAIALNIWGDREVTWIDGRKMSEKELARTLNVQFTPTILIFDEAGDVAVRMNGYYPPNRFEAVLDFAAAKLERSQRLSDYLVTAAKERASPKLHDEPFFMAAPYDLRRKTGGKPLAVVFETADCAPCDEMHREGFRRKEVLAQVQRFDVARFSLTANTALTTPDGRESTARAWARELDVVYTPTIVFFGDGGREAFRIDAYTRPFHLSSSFAYVAEGVYRHEPEFQRYLQARAEAIRSRGERVELLE
ncbi:MAG: thioredoxin fold domain-containing protein [Burkholderiales bacterium]|nr:thioredoxin fold domain-containing protein [Burkholderiales bacterium]